MVLAPPTADNGASHPDEPRTCQRCGHRVEVFTLELPMGLGPRTFTSECPCERERRAAVARERAAGEHRERVRACFRQSGIGRRHEAASFENFVTSPATAAVVEVCRAFVAAFPQGGKGLTLSGPAGTGKTHLAVAVTHALIDRGVSALIVNVPMLLLTFRGTFSGDRPERFDRMLDLLCRCEHLVLDDLGRERSTEWAQETLYLVVNARYQECLATSLTTNLSPAELRARLGEPILDRLAETNQGYWCQWSSHRRRSTP
jgi:DNA replication protein DnaC